MGSERKAPLLAKDARNGAPTAYPVVGGRRGNILLVAFSDTSPAAQEVQLQIYRAMTGEQRLRLAFEMSLLARELMKASIRNDHPDWPEERVIREVIRLAFLPDLPPPALR